MDKRIAEAWVLGITSILAIYFLGMTYQFPEVGGIGPRSFPAAIFWGLLGLNGVRAVILVKDFRRNKNNVTVKLTIWNFIPRLSRETVIMVGMIILYAILCGMVGFVIASSFYVMTISWFLASGRQRSFVKYAIISVTFVLVIYLSFSYAFKMQLPQGMFGGVL